jgi:cell division protein FtsQ
MNAWPAPCSCWPRWRCWRPGCCGWRARRCSPSAPSASKATWQRNSVPTIRANARRAWPATSSALDLAAARAAFEAVPWVRRPWCAASGPTAWRCAWRSTAPVALWQGEDGATAWSTASARSSRPTSATSRTTAAGLQRPRGQRGAMLAMLPRLQPVLRAAGHGRSSSCAVRPRLLARAARQRRHARTGPRQRGRGGERTQRFVRTLPPGDRPLPRAAAEHADLRHADGYAVRLRGVTTTRCRRRRQGRRPPSRPPWPRNTRISSSAWTSAPPR